MPSRDLSIGILVRGSEDTKRPLLGLHRHVRCLALSDHHLKLGPLFLLHQWHAISILPVLPHSLIQIGMLAASIAIQQFRAALNKEKDRLRYVSLSTTHPTADHRILFPQSE